jgi:hypothetical protein
VHYIELKDRISVNQMKRSWTVLRYYPELPGGIEKKNGKNYHLGYLGSRPTTEYGTSYIKQACFHSRQVFGNG